METELFTWQGFDEVSDNVLQFYEVILKVQIGSFLEGTRFDHAVLDYEEGFVTLVAGEVECKYKISFAVGELVT